MAAKPVVGIDLDGTILDCRPRQEAVLLKLVPNAKRHADALWHLKREGLSTLAALKRLGLDRPKGFKDNWLKLIENPDFLCLDPLLPGAPEALERLSNSAELHLITARQNSDGVFETLNRFSILPFFANVAVVPSGQTSGDAKKLYLQKHSAVAHIGDTEVDGQAAAGAGVPFWAVTCGQRSETYLRAYTSPYWLGSSLLEVAKKKVV